MQAQSGNLVKVHYTGTLSSGEVFDTSIGADPLEFTLGNGQMIPGFEDAVYGMTLNETRTVTIQSADAYGERSDEMLINFPKDKFPEGFVFEEGLQLGLNQSSGETLTVTLVKVLENEVILDANHPLAGCDLTFEITLTEIN